MKLHKIKGRNRYCGPAVISALTGCTTDEAAVVIRSISFQESVKGVHTHHLRRALHAFNVATYSQRDVKGKTLTQWLKATDRPSGKVFLVVAGNHFQIVTGRRYLDNATKTPVSVKDEKVRGRSRVEEVFVLDAGKLTKPPALTRWEHEQKEKRRIASFRPKAKRLAEKHGCRIEIDDIGEGLRHFWIWGKDEVEAHQDYPFEGDHIVNDWEDAFRRIEAIIEFEKSLPECDPLGVLG